MPADRRPPRGPVRPPTRRDDPLATQRRRVERIWALALARFRDHLHDADRNSSDDSSEHKHPTNTAEDDDDCP